MLRALSLSAAITSCWSAYAADQAIVGAFELKLGKPGNSVEIRLDCASESSCTFLTTSQWKNDPPRQDKQVLGQVSPVGDLTQATNALKYAIGQQSRTIKHEEFAETMNRLRPVLAANPGIDKCWDLNYTSPRYMLVCTLSNAPADSPPIYLFGTLLANCGEAFCRYVINPMVRVK